uniref:Oxysterol-binding protein-related protein 1C n=1 Tax=Rhizophora mucronata TaxID=61149 RepID=A0A2P2KF08_RHIMU
MGIGKPGNTEVGIHVLIYSAKSLLINSWTDDFHCLVCIGYSILIDSLSIGDVYLAWFEQLASM